MPTIDGFRPVEVAFKEKSDRRSCSGGMDIRGSLSEICATVIRVRLGRVQHVEGVVGQGRMT